MLTKKLLLLLLFTLLLAACGGAATETPGPQTDNEMMDNPAVQALVKNLAAEFEVAAEAITVQGVRATEWPDTCMGLHVSGMACAEAITPGYIIYLQMESTLMVFHSNEDGSRTFLASATE